MNTRALYTFDSLATYLIAGGLGGLGREIARWMASRGARHMVLLSRSGGSTESGKAILDELSATGIHVEAPACDITDLGLLSRVLKDCSERMPPIRGCVQSTMVLRVGLPELKLKATLLALADSIRRTLCSKT